MPSKMSRSWVMAFSLMALSSLIRASAWHKLWCVVHVPECLDRYLLSTCVLLLLVALHHIHTCICDYMCPVQLHQLVMNFHWCDTFTWRNEITVCTMTYDVSHRHASFKLIDGNTVCMWCSLMAVWQHRPSRCVSYMVKSEFRWLFHMRQAVALFSAILFYVYGIELIVTLSCPFYKVDMLMWFVRTDCYSVLFDKQSQWK